MASDHDGPRRLYVLTHGNTAPRPARADQGPGRIAVDRHCEGAHYRIDAAKLV